MKVQLTQVNQKALAADLLKDAISIFGLDAAPSIVLRETIRNPYSEVHVFEITQNKFFQRIFVKIPHSEFQALPILKTRLIAEFRIMQRLHVLGMEGRDNGVGVPFGYYPEYPALATLEAANKTLRMHYRTKARLIAPTSSRDCLMREVSNCGLWLRDFQKVTEKERAPFDIDELITYSGVRLKRLLGQNDIEFPNSLAEGITKSIQELGENIQADENRIVGRHNDFASHNILASDGRVWIIDFNMFDYGSNAYDPCNFWLDMEMLKHDATYSKPFLGALQERFLNSYGLISQESPAFNLARCRYTLNRLVTSLSGAKGWTPEKYYRRRVVRACLDWLESFAAESTQV